MPAFSPRGPRPGRLLGLYALATMDREGSVYGYALADRIAERTGGTWRPGPGAVYPALEALVRRRLARATVQGRRRFYRTTAQGRRTLRGIRRQMLWRRPLGPDLGLLWSEIAGEDDFGRFQLNHLESHLERIEEYLARSDTPPARRASLRREVLRRLRRAERRIAPGTVPPGTRGPVPREVA